MSPAIPMTLAGLALAAAGVAVLVIPNRHVHHRSRRAMNLSYIVRRTLLLVIITGALLAFTLPVVLPWSGTRL